MNNFYELEPRYDSRMSFYRKAFVKVGKNNKLLFSYGTPVCKIMWEESKNSFDTKYYVFLTNKVEDSLLFSQTTLRHIKEFIRQETGSILSKKELMYCAKYVALRG